MVALHLELSEEDYRLVAELAARRGESIADLVAEATRELARRDRLEAGAGDVADRLVAIGRRASAYWTEPWKSSDHGDLLYDENGLPR